MSISPARTFEVEDSDWEDWSVLVMIVTLTSHPIADSPEKTYTIMWLFAQQMYLPNFSIPTLTAQRNLLYHVL